MSPRARRPAAPPTKGRGSKKTKTASKAKAPMIAGAQRRSLVWRFRRFFFFSGVLVIATAIGGLWAASQVQIPTTNPVLDQTSFVCTADVKTDCNEKNAIASLHGNVNRVVVPLSDISPEMQNAILAAEDKDFFKHGGVDPVGIARAALIDIRGGGVTHGGSTLTQQYVKLTYLTSQRTLTRKLKEAALAIKLEQELSKTEIFERYLNLVYFGRGAYGVQAAAQSYFNTDAKSLTLPQAAFLAAIIRNPSWATDAKRTTSLRRIVLGNMADNGMIDEAQRAEADAAPLGVQDFMPSQGVNWLGGEKGSPGEDPDASRYFVQSVIEKLEDELGTETVFGGGLRIYTTLEPKLQHSAYEAVTSVLGFEGAPNGALVSIDNQGHIVAMVGGTDYASDKVNLATGRGGGGRPSGSTFKAYALAELVKQGYSIGSSVLAEYKTTFLKSDYPELNEDYDVRSDCCTGGAASVIDATAMSINSSFVQMMLELGPENVDRMAHELGVSSPFERREGDKVFHLASYVLGSQSVSVVDVADSYSTFARNGVQLDPILVTRVEDREGNVLASYHAQRKAVLSPAQNSKVVYALQQVMLRGTGTSANIDRPAAGKTGTVAVPDQDTGDESAAVENTDAWFTGFVPGFTSAVWMGNQDGKPMPASFAGASYPAEIWKRYMTAALADVKKTDFAEPGDRTAGKYLTSWGGVTYAQPAPTAKDYDDGQVSPQNPNASGGQGQGGQGQYQGQGQGGQTQQTTPESVPTDQQGPAATAPPATAPASTAEPPPPTDPPVTDPPPPDPPASESAP